MRVETKMRDYGIVGEESAAALKKGLAAAKWYSSPLSRDELKALVKRRDWPGIRDTIIWLTALIVSGFIAWKSWGTWWAVPAFFVYGTLYASPSDSRWHECGHRTAFKTQWLNDAVYQIAAFCVLRQPTPWRWSHTRHHTDTIIVGRDPEINAKRPPEIGNILLNVFNLSFGVRELGRMLVHCAGRLTIEEREFIPESERWKVCRVARIWCAIFAAVIVLSIAIGSTLPLMFIGLPSFYGAWLHLLFNLTQHAGLAEDVLDHRLNTRTVYMNPIFQFIYWNMNYHVEHHMFPMVPYYALPALHEKIKADTPQAYKGLIETYREIIPTLLRQLKDPRYFVERKLPAASVAQRPSLGATSRKPNWTVG
ncbi:MAG TPA: fatty acid desaturase family protein [Roseiarcus sp.]|nr:fatty acid desaturase family protein [Roseiarcus sp.]